MDRSMVQEREDEFPDTDTDADVAAAVAQLKASSSVSSMRTLVSFLDLWESREHGGEKQRRRITFSDSPRQDCGGNVVAILRVCLSKAQSVSSDASHRLMLTDKQCFGVQERRETEREKDKHT